MARIPRLLLPGESATYHIVSRTALQGFVLGDVEKDLFVRLLRRLAAVYFVELFGFCVMGNHVHLLVRMRLADEFPDEEVRRRFTLYYGEARAQTLGVDQLPFYREKWANCADRPMLNADSDAW